MQTRPYASHITGESDQHDGAKSASAMVENSSSKNFSGIDFSRRTLPQNLTGANLTGANLSGLHFTTHNFKDAQLTDVILRGSTCDYMACFEDNVEASQRNIRNFYLERIRKYLKSITQVYPQLLQDSHKALLLQIASGLAYLPYYKRTQFRIKMGYWGCQLLLFKEKIGTLGHQLACTFDFDLNYHAKCYCWQTDYPAQFESDKGILIACQWCRASTSIRLPSMLGIFIQSCLTEPVPPKHTHFDSYLELFQKGLVKYNVKSTHDFGYHMYKKAIEKNIQGIKKAYPNLPSKALKQEMVDIAHTLSESYKVEHLPFLCCYLACQNRLIELKSLAGVEGEKEIFYSKEIWIGFTLKKGIDFRLCV